MKKIFGILGSLAVAASAHAQSSVAVGGVVDEYAGSMRNAGDVKRTKVLNSGGMTTSYFGFSGVEDMGGGLKAFFNLNAFFQADTGAIGRFTGDTFFARDANIGLTGTYGSLAAGRGKAPNFLPSVFVNPFGDSFTFSPLILHENVNTTTWRYATTPSDTGWGNQLVYTTPTFSGLSGSVQYQFGEQNPDSKKNVGASVTYLSGPWTAVAFYERDQVTNPNPALITATVNGATVPATRKDWMIGGAYNAGFVKALRELRPVQDRRDQLRRQDQPARRERADRRGLRAGRRRPHHRRLRHLRRPPPDGQPGLRLLHVQAHRPLCRGDARPDDRAGQRQQPGARHPPPVLNPTPGRPAPGTELVWS